ncbi:IS200/IS605 family element transposase accessory protein TnpB [Saccharopolyspora erythraea]|uniref:RNA-guided endonuclease InsQ/TnpB family protein n=1 Tax=Saccharopolyspora erythraea TaxID=1836 RepID=UPI001BAB4438|nr:RNA-guided endonuclease TnpB family protein [Saccharopolyspora erythraea]QUH03466.1 IS200/IS605 family element transposase accessory protein TnpB [Saccharopolyspora erythraea]
MRTAYKVRAYPDPERAAQLGRTFGCVRLVWNKTLDQRHRIYHAHGTKTSYKETDAALTACKRTDELAFLSEVSSVPLQQALRHQHTAFQNFFSGRSKYPRFKSRNGKQSAHYTRSAFRLRDGTLTLAKHTAALAFVWSWDNDTLAKLNPTMVIVSRELDGRWYLTFAVDTDDPEPTEPTGNMVGVDLGVQDFAVLSTGEKIANPKHLDRKARNLARYQRQMARKQRGSNNRRKAKNKVARAHRKVRHARADFLHKTSTRLVREHDVIAIEDLNVAGMSRSAKGTVDKPGRNVRAKAGLNRAVSDAALGEFRRQLEYKTDRAGKTLVVIDRWYPSSKTCSHCGHLLNNLKLSVRAWKCPGCGTRHDRDHNAAKNILAAGLAVAGNNPGDACGAGVSRQGSSLPQSATKQELSGASPKGITAL